MRAFLPVFQRDEEEGDDGQHRRSRDSPPRWCPRPSSGPLSDLEILRELADWLGCGEKFAFRDTEAVFNEFRRATAGGACRLLRNHLREDLRERWRVLAVPVGGAPGHAADVCGSVPPRRRPREVLCGRAPRRGEEPNYGVSALLHDGALQGALLTPALEARMVAKLEAARPLPRLELHPRLAIRRRIATGSRVTVESSAGKVEFAAEETPDIRPGTLFAVPLGRARCGQHSDQRVTRPDQPDAGIRLSAVRIVGVR